MTDAELISALEQLRDLLVDVATGRSRIDDANDSYRRHYGNVASELVTRGLRNPVPFGDLWDW